MPHERWLESQGMSTAARIVVRGFADLSGMCIALTTARASYASAVNDTQRLATSRSMNGIA
jgi:hypothetical protein